MRVYLFFIASFALAVTAQPDQKDAGKNGARELDGKWIIVSLVAGGKVEEDRGTYVFKDNNVTFQIGGDEGTGPFKLDAKKNPKWIDIGPKGEIIGHLRTEGRDAQALPSWTGKKRPAEFKSTREGGEALIELKRAKP